MTATTISEPFGQTLAAPSGFIRDTLTVAGRALRAVPRDLEGVIPPMFIAIFFFICRFGMSRYSLYLEKKLHTGH